MIHSQLNLSLCAHSAICTEHVWDEDVSSADKSDKTFFTFGHSCFIEDNQNKWNKERKQISLYF